jgi:Uncharacterized protein conserved in bacteria (DUF2059)
MKNILLIATLLAATAFSGLAGAGEISGASQHRLLMLSGIHDMVAHFPGLLRLRMEQARQRDRIFHSHPGMSDEDYQELENTMVDAFKPADIIRAIGKQVSASVSEQDAEEMLAWYDSDLGKKISKAEDESSTPEAYRDMARSAKSLLADKERVAFAIKLDKLLHMTDMSMQFQVNAAVAMLVAFSTRMNEHRPANQKAFRKRISAGLEKERYKIRRGVILSTVYTYRKIDMDSLEKYGAFLKTPAALHFNEALMAGMDAGMTQAIDRMARSVETLFKQKHLQQA